MDQDHKFFRWKQTRRNGMLSYVSKRFLFCSIALISGRFISLYLFEDPTVIEVFFQNFPRYFLMVVSACFILCMLEWHIKELMFRRKLAKHNLEQS